MSIYVFFSAPLVCELCCFRLARILYTKSCTSIYHLHTQILYYIHFFCANIYIFVLVVSLVLFRWFSLQIVPWLLAFCFQFSIGYHFIFIIFAVTIFLNWNCQFDGVLIKYQMFNWPDDSHVLYSLFVPLWFRFTAEFCLLCCHTSSYRQSYMR